MTTKTQLRALLELGSESMANIAKRAHVDQGNLSAWFTQDRYMSEEAISRITHELGVEDEELKTDRVYVWQTTRNFDQLQLLLDTFFRNPRLMPLNKIRIRRYELAELFERPMAVITDDDGHKVFVMLKTSAIKDAFASSKTLPWFSPDYLRGTAWLKPIQDESVYPFPEPLQLPTQTLNAWKKGVVSIDEFNVLLQVTEKISWQQLFEKATEMDLEPANIWPWLDAIKSARGLSAEKLESKLENLKR